MYYCLFSVLTTVGVRRIFVTFIQRITVDFHFVCVLENPLTLPVKPDFLKTTPYLNCYFLLDVTNGLDETKVTEEEGNTAEEGKCL